MSEKPEIVSPNWLDISHLGAPDYEEQLDANPGNRRRHRLRRPTGEIAAEWRDGPAPLRKTKP